MNKKLKKAGITNSPGYNPKKDKYLKAYYKNIKQRKRKIKLIKNILLWMLFSFTSFIIVYITLEYIKAM